MILLRRMIGDALRARRQSQRRTLREVSTAANVSLGYLSEIERGQKEASSELLAAICDALGAQLSELLREVSHTVEAAESVAVPAGRPTHAPVPVGRAAAGRASLPSADRAAILARSVTEPMPEPVLVGAGAPTEYVGDQFAAEQFAGDHAGTADAAFPAPGVVLKASENARHPRLTVDSDVVVSVHQSGPFRATLRTTRNVRNAKRGREVACVG